MNLQEVLQWLTEQGYVTASKEKGYSLTKRFQDDVKKGKRRTPADIIDLDVPITLNVRHEVVPHTINWTLEFVKFIDDAKVPKRLEGSRGAEYAPNKYSEHGMKAFKKALEEGIDYNMLVRSTMLYYKSSLGFKKTIGNYMADGDWRSDYLNLQSVAAEGVDQLHNHVKQETKSNEYNAYRLG